MTKAQLMELVGKKVLVVFKDGERGIYGTLGYADEFSEKHDYRKSNFFYIGNTSFKASVVKASVVDEKYEVEVVTRGKCMMCGKELTDGLFFCGECEDKRRMGNEATRKTRQPTS